MRLYLRTQRACLLMMCFMIVTISACGTTPIAQITQVVPVTRMVQVTQVVDITRVIPVTRIVKSTPIEVTRIVLAAEMVEVTRIVYLTRIVIVEAPQLTPAPTSARQPTNPPTPPPAPIPTLSPVATATKTKTHPPAPTASNDLLVWYDFEGDYLTTGMITDRSGNGFDAQVYGSVGATEGISGDQAILFSGNGYIQAQTNPVAGRNIVSFSLWFKTDHPEANYKLASAAWWNGGPASGWILATHLPEFWSDDNNGLYLPDMEINDNYFTPGEWNHEVVTYDGSTIKEYTNGELVNDWPTTGAAIGQGLPMAVGGWPQYNGFNFQGSIDEFQIFGWALSPEEIQAIYNQR